VTLVPLATRADRAKDKARCLVSESRLLVNEAQKLVIQARRLRSRRARGPHASCSFVVQGSVGDVPVSAWWDEEGLTCDPLLMRHAELVVALGETFSCGRDGTQLVASLNAPPTQVLLTLIRAMKVSRLQYERNGMIIELDASREHL